MTTLNGIGAPLLAASAPGWLVSAVIVVIAIILAITTVVLMLIRPRTVEAGDDGVVRRTVDPMLILSALVVVGLAIAAWLLR
ncbi:MAG TPA: hypothetical protein PK593_01260 [Thermomicrobiales bacterium]|nr:hypothetical protein [Chloroflexota bacterium]HCG28379.1 hypothetical protein [Chloroflexota bacterium]HQX62064.1 hypothetical protein [Thermomicrobiales bacterium]HQZ89384.1 hypothetical protein [Thermomicrobiales bacterium]HRA32430.1 hypothetical protein [Thermomicrobiales bacterium]